jgi:hypothetical protein
MSDRGWDLLWGWLGAMLLVAGGAALMGALLVEFGWVS